MTKKEQLRRENKLLRTLKARPVNYDELIEETSMSKKEIRNYMDLLTKRGIEIDRIKQGYDQPAKFMVRAYPKTIEEPFIFLKHLDDGIFKIAAFSDPHCNDKYFLQKALEEYEKDCIKEGVDLFTICGDIDTGQGVYKGQDNDLLRWGANTHLDWLEENFMIESEDIPKLFIGGNHEESFLRLNGTDICKLLSERRKDLKYLGMYYRRVLYGDIKNELIHPAGHPYSVGYGNQKYFRTQDLKNAGDMYDFGHWHSSMFMDYQGVLMYNDGTFQRENDFTRRHGFFNIVGGWIKKLRIKDGYIKEVENLWKRYR